MKPLPAVVLSALFAGCATIGDDGMNAAMAAWKGRPATDAISMWGMPDSMNREGTRMMLTWKADNTMKSWMQPVTADAAGDSKRRNWPTRCYRVLAVDETETIKSARVFGSDCSTDPADYATP